MNNTSNKDYRYFPEAETMETRKVLRKRLRFEGFLWGFFIAMLAAMFIGNLIIAHSISQ